MGRGDELFWVGTLLVFEPRPERIGSFGEHTGIGGNIAATGTTGAAPNRFCLPHHLIILPCVLRLKAAPDGCPPNNERCPVPGAFGQPCRSLTPRSTEPLFFYQTHVRAPARAQHEPSRFSSNSSVSLSRILPMNAPITFDMLAMVRDPFHRKSSLISESNPCSAVASALYARQPRARERERSASAHRLTHRIVRHSNAMY
jgi:hypothetical protein